MTHAVVQRIKADLRATRAPVAAAPARRPAGARALSAQATREAILRAAIAVFAEHGFSGGSVDKISTAAGSVDRMIYYYFGSKKGLFVAALEEIYRRFNAAEATLQLDEDKPVESLRAVIGFALNYYRRHPEFINLLNSENLHRGVHTAKSPRLREYPSRSRFCRRPPAIRGASGSRRPRWRWWRSRRPSPSSRRCSGSSTSAAFASATTPRAPR